MTPTLSCTRTKTRVDKVLFICHSFLFRLHYFIIINPLESLPMCLKKMTNTL